MNAHLQISFTTLVLLLLGLGHTAQQVEKREQYLLVFDAGSTGTRLNAFRFEVDAAHSTGLRLLSLEEKKVKPGLSAYANFPSRLRGPLRSLLEFAKQKIPGEFQANTTAIVRATAGLRLLTPAARRRVVAVVEDELRRSAFRAPSRNSVRVISGIEEAVFGWVAVNFLLDAFDKPVSDTYGMLDMGGGSTQITFVPADSTTAGAGKLIQFRTVHGKVYNLHQHSYLGLGLSAATLQMLGYRKSGSSSQRYESPCLNPNYNGEFKFGSEAANFSGSASPTGAERFNACSKVSQQTLKLHHLHKPGGVQQAKFVAVSSFYYVTQTLYRAYPSWAVKAPAEIPVSYFTNAARRVCANPPIDGRYKAYLCPSLTHVANLLRFGYQFAPNQTLLVTGEIDGYSASWPLGLAIHYLTCDDARPNSCLSTRSETSNEYGAIVVSAAHLLPLVLAAILL